VLGQGLSKTQQVSEIGCWDGNQKLSRSARLGAGRGIVKNSIGWVRLGAGMEMKYSDRIARMEDAGGMYY
jgi:hypothetical protein